VPENRSDPESRDIRLHVAVFKSTSENPSPDPVVFLSGGPGQGAVESLAFDATLSGYVDFLQSRDLIVLDQRGTGYSEPDLRCPELDELDESIPTGVSGELPEEVAAALIACSTRLAGEGADLSAYNSAENAADFADLRLALEIDEWNLLGLSYGTRLAQTIVRDHPEGIRSVIFDSAYPIEADLYEPALQNTDRALTALQAECSVPGGPCADRPETFKETLYDLAMSLNEEPVDIMVTDQVTGEETTVSLNGTDLINVVYAGLYTVQIISHLPGMVYSAVEGDYDMIALLMSALQANDLTSMGMNLSVQCAEEVPFTDLAAMNEISAGYPELQDIVASNQTFVTSVKQTCEVWGFGNPPPVENEPVTDGVMPVLVLAGNLDPITPPEWGEMLSGNFADSSFFEFRGIGHAVTIDSECGRQIALQFLDTLNPLPDAEALCVGDLPGVEFVDPLTSINLVEFNDPEVLGIAGLEPEGWLDTGDPTIQQYSELGLYVILQQAAPVSQEDFLASYFPSIGLEEAPEPAGTFESPYATWTLFEFTQQGLVVNLAVGEIEDGRLGIVLTTSLPNTHDLVYSSLFLGAVEALRPAE
jgi:pimeloyl-ACP methyl ester carboxylesterase